MSDLELSTITGERTVLKEAAVKQFKTDLRGEILQPGDDGYDDARKVFNAMIDKRPAMILRCTGVADVIAAVNFARTNNLLVSVRGGGHSVAGNAVCDGGLVIDLSRMKGIRVDPVRRTARAECGATNGDLDREMQAFGLATLAEFTPAPVSPASPWAVGSATSTANMGSPVITCCRPTW